MSGGSALIGPRIALMGPSGTGKTYAIGTLVDWAAAQTPPRKVFVLFTENGAETLLGYWRDRNLPVPENLHWHLQMTTPLNLGSLMEGAKNVGKMGLQSITSWIDPNRGKNNAFYGILESCFDFPDDRTGERFGSVDTWEADRIFVIDSLSELSNAAMKMQIGAKPAASQADYQVAQVCLLNFLRLCTQGIRPTFVLTAHVDRQLEELTGITKVMIRSIGKALTGEIPQLFSDVILTMREGDKFYWDTAASNADVKSRNLPIKIKQSPTFATIMDTWSKRADHAGGEGA